MVLDQHAVAAHRLPTMQATDNISVALIQVLTPAQFAQAAVHSYPCASSMLRRLRCLWHAVANVECACAFQCRLAVAASTVLTSSPSCYSTPEAAASNLVYLLRRFFPRADLIANLAAQRDGNDMSMG